MIYWSRIPPPFHILIKHVLIEHSLKKIFSLLLILKNVYFRYLIILDWNFNYPNFAHPFYSLKIYFKSISNS